MRTMKVMMEEMSSKMDNMTAFQENAASIKRRTPDMGGVMFYNRDGVIETEMRPIYN